MLNHLSSLVPTYTAANKRLRLVQRANGSLYVLPSQCNSLSELNGWTREAGPETDTYCGDAILQRESYSAKLFGVLCYRLSEVNEITSAGDNKECLNRKHQKDCLSQQSASELHD